MRRASEYVGRVRYAFPDCGGENVLREVILYICTHAQVRDDDTFGAVRLNKVILEADQEAFLSAGKPITGVEYVREKQGPVPRFMDQVLKGMEREGLIQEIRAPHPTDPTKTMRYIKPLRPANEEIFSQPELWILDEVIHTRSRETAAQASKRTHGVAWKVAKKDRTPIPYESAFLSDEEITQSDIQRTQELGARFGWTSY